MTKDKPIVAVVSSIVVSILLVLAPLSLSPPCQFGFSLVTVLPRFSIISNKFLLVYIKLTKYAEFVYTQVKLCSFFHHFILLPLSQDGLISATLCDTTTDEDIHINDTLVSQGLAIFVKDTEEEERKYDGYQPEPLPLGVSIYLWVHYCTYMESGKIFFYFYCVMSGLPTTVRRRFLHITLRVYLFSSI